ncbi:MAG: hypothetical protein JW934_23765 [Anaerolineae bacterium]|nr:hypothetical protein [Anaerolineae bacterium]
MVSRSNSSTLKKISALPLWLLLGGAWTGGALGVILGVLFGWINVFLSLGAGLGVGIGLLGYLFWGSRIARWLEANIGTHHTYGDSR